MEECSSSSSSRIAVLPSEIIAEILSRLPVKSLVRFKTVSKSFNYLIKSPNFIHQTLTSSSSSSSSNNHRIIISHSTVCSSADTDTLSFSELPHPLLPPPSLQPTLNYFADPPGVLLIGQARGVVCISNATKSVVYLYSPGTRTQRCVPRSHIMYPEDFVVFGFMFDGFRHDYKLLRIVQCRESYCHVRFYNEAKVYSLRDHEWRFVREMPYVLVYKDCNGVFVEGGVHFVVGKEGVKYIVRFDVEKEEFGEVMEMPGGGDEYEVSKLVLRELGGCLCVMVNDKSGFWADLWVMREYGKAETWERVLCLEVWPRFCEVRPVVYSSDGRRVLLLVDNCELQWCELRGGEERVRVVRSCALLDEPFDAGVYVESIVSLDDWQCDSRGKRNKKKDDIGDFLSVGFKLKL
ncbi:hypothetical protein vseg_011474 [Gypsophila vaccaria]